MKDLILIMRDFLEVEYNQKSLLYILELLEATYNEEAQEEAKLIVNSTKYYLKNLQEELRSAINELDTYIAEQPKKQQKQSTVTSEK